MGAERPGQVRQFGRPAFQKFDAGLPGNNGVLGSGERRGSGQPFSLDRPVDLVGNIRAMVQQARAEWRGGSVKFDAAFWLRRKLKVTFFEAGYRNVPQETQELMRDVMCAYDILAYPHFLYDDYRRSVGIDLSVFAEGGVTLEDPRGVQLLEAMVEATDVPYTPGQKRFELPDEVIQQHFPSRAVDVDK